MKKFNLTKAMLADKPVVENMWYYYVYDLTRYCGFIKGWEAPTELSFRSDDLTRYFTDSDSHLFLINIGNEHAGFVLVKKLEVMPEVDWFMGEFFIISKFQRSGIGQEVVKEIFDKFPGEWAVGVLPENVGALNFWRKVIIEYAHGNFYEVEKTSEQLKTSEHPDPYPMVILRFKTPWEEIQTNNFIRQNMEKIILREPKLEDENAFLAMAQQSQTFHHPWVKVPLTHNEFIDYIQRYQQPNQKSFLVCSPENYIIGVFNISEIVYGCFQSAYLGFYVSHAYAGKGWMSKGLRLLLKKAFVDLSLHRLEANIQPQNTSSIWLVQSNGFRKEGFSPRYLKIDNEWRDHERWALTIEDWKNRDGHDS